MKKALRAGVIIMMLSSVCFAAEGGKDVGEKLSITYPQLRITSVLSVSHTGIIRGCRRRKT